VGAGFLPVVYLVAYAFVGSSNTRPVVPLASFCLFPMEETLSAVWSSLTVERDEPFFITVYQKFESWYSSLKIDDGIGSFLILGVIIGIGVVMFLVFASSGPTKDVSALSPAIKRAPTTMDDLTSQLSVLGEDINKLNESIATNKETQKYLQEKLKTVTDNLDDDENKLKKKEETYSKCLAESENIAKNSENLVERLKHENEEKTGNILWYVAASMKAIAKTTHQTE
jgi:hypothetical protein